MIVLVDPVSTGPYLSRAFKERGEEPLHLYQSWLSSHYAADPHPRKVLCARDTNVLDHLSGEPVTAVVAGSESGVTLANQLSHTLGLPSNNDDLVSRKSLRFNHSEMLFEDFLDGPQYVVNTVSIGGRHLVSDIHGVRVDRIDDRSTIRHSLLVTEWDESTALLAQFTLRCLDTAGIGDGAAHTKIRLTANGPRLIGVNARLTDASLEPSLYRTALGYTQADLVAERFIDPAAFVDRFNYPYSPYAAVAVANLRIADLAGLEFVRSLPACRSMAVSAGTTGRGLLAYFLHQDRELVAISLERLHQFEDTGAYADQDIDVTPTLAHCGS